MPSRRIALVPEIAHHDASELLRVCAALQKQVNRDLQPAWGVSASVDAFVALDDVPLGYWPVLLTDDPSLGRRAGLHLDYAGQPLAVVRAGAQWSIAASQACLQMLVNPLGTRTIEAPAQRAGGGLVQALVDVCGPCGDSRFAYLIDGIPVSDFCMPGFFDGRAEPAARFSYTGAATQALRPIGGGNVVWYEPDADRYVLRSQRDGQLSDVDLGAKHGQGLSLPELLSACEELRLRHEAPLPQALQRAAEEARWAALDRARDLRDWMDDERLESRLSALPSLRAHASTPVELLAPTETSAAPEYAWVEAIDVEELPSATPADDAEERSVAAGARERSVPPPLRPGQSGAPAHGVTSLAPVVRGGRPLGRSPRGVAWLAPVALFAAAVGAGSLRVEDGGASQVYASAAPPAHLRALASNVTKRVAAEAAPDASPATLSSVGPYCGPPPDGSASTSAGSAPSRLGAADTQRARTRAPKARPAPPVERPSASAAAAPVAPPPVVSITSAPAPTAPTAPIDALIESRR